MDKHMDKKSNVSSPVILLLSFLFIALESVRLFTGKQSAYFTDAILPAVWIAAYFLIIAVLLLAGECAANGTTFYAFPWPCTSFIAWR